jgi:hypothetical protein
VVIGRIMAEVALFFLGQKMELISSFEICMKVELESKFFNWIYAPLLPLKASKNF